MNSSLCYFPETGLSIFAKPWFSETPFGRINVVQKSAFSEINISEKWYSMGIRIFRNVFRENDYSSEIDIPPKQDSSIFNEFWLFENPVSSINRDSLESNPRKSNCPKRISKNLDFYDYRGWRFPRKSLFSINNGFYGFYGFHGFHGFYVFHGFSRFLRFYGVTVLRFLRFYGLSCYYGYYGFNCFHRFWWKPIEIHRNPSESFEILRKSIEIHGWGMAVAWLRPRKASNY